MGLSLRHSILYRVTVRMNARNLFLSCFSCLFKPLACLEAAAQRSGPSVATSVPVARGEDAIVKIVDALIALCSRPAARPAPENTSGHQISAVNLPFYLERQK